MIAHVALEDGVQLVLLDAARYVTIVLIVLLLVGQLARVAL